MDETPKYNCGAQVRTHAKRLYSGWVRNVEMPNEKIKRKSLLSNVGKIQRQMSRTMIYVKETQKCTQKDIMGLV
jgi:hypothetical protein